MSHAAHPTSEYDLFEERTTHASRTLMVADLEILFGNVGGGEPGVYTAAILDENVLRRRSASARSKSREHLRAMYSLDGRDAIFRGMRKAYDADEGSLPLLAMLCGLTRDAVLRATAGKVLGAAFGSHVSTGDLRSEVERCFPERFSASSLDEIGSRTLSSWRQSGHVSGGVKRYRDRAKASPGSVAFAMYLGHLSGVRGLPLLDTFWSRVLDVSEGEMDSLAFAASQRGLMEYRRMGDVAEFGFSEMGSG